jgi:polar amino acid transport system substrate-binding protein
MKRKFFVLAIAAATVALAFALCGCSLLETPESYTPTKKDPTVASPVIGRDGVLRVGVNSSNAPFSAQVSGNIVGIDIDIAAALADEMGLALEVVDVGTDPEGALAAGTVDVIMNVGTTNTTTTCWTSSPYLQTSVALFAADPNAPLPFGGSQQPAEGNASTDEAAAEGNAEEAATAEGSEEAVGAAATTKVAAQASSMSAWEVANQYGEEALQTVDDLKTAFNDLSAGNVSYVAADAIIGSYVAHSSASDSSIIGIMEAASGYCVGCSTENADLQAAIASALDSMNSSGIVKVIERKWLGSAIDIESYAMTDAATAGAAEAAADTSEDEASGEEIAVEGSGEVGANAAQIVDDGGEQG